MQNLALSAKIEENSNTTLVKVKLSIGKEQDVQCKNSNTTLVKVKLIVKVSVPLEAIFKYNTC